MDNDMEAGVIDVYGMSTSSPFKEFVGVYMYFLVHSNEICNNHGNIYGRGYRF